MSVNLSADAIRDAVRILRHPLPRLRSSMERTREPTVLFCCPDYDVPSGGIRVAYRHVDILNSAGIPAAILHRRPGFRVTWFEHDTRVLSSREWEVEPDDVVVVGELDTSLLDDLPPGFRFVIFNQNVHLTWKRTGAGTVARRLRGPDLAALVTVSDHGAETLRYAFPEVQVLRVHNAIDPAIFHPGSGPGSGAPRESTIAFMPRRDRQIAAQVLGMLAARGSMDGWRVVEIDGVEQGEVGRQLRRASIFLSLSMHEGFGLPAAEAMACGVYVVGFDGFAGREFFRAAFCSPVPAGDVLEFARVLEHVIILERRQPGWCEGHAAAAASYVRETYPPARERGEVIAIYSGLMERSPSR